MAARQQNPREQIEDALATARRLLRYWWLVGLVTVAGTSLAVMFALRRPRVYEASTVIMHRDVIPSDLLQGNRGASSARYMRTRFREMLLARPLLEKVIEDGKLFPNLLAREGMTRAVERLRGGIGFSGKGGGTFYISYRGATPTLAKDVTTLLARHLIEWELRLQLESVSITKNFLEREAKRLADQLAEAEKKFAEFLAAHPEFADEVLVATGAAGASIRAARQPDTKGAQTPQNRTRLYALERQRARLQARLDKPEQPAVGRPQPPTKEEREATEAVAEAQREVDRETRRLEQLRLKFTDLHPDVQAVQRQLARARGTLAQAKARVASARRNRPKPVLVKPVSADERKQLLASIRNIDAAIIEERNRLAKGGKPKPAADPDTSRVVELETEWSRLFRRVKEMRERHASIESKAFTADILASSEIARQGVQLTIVNPAQLPTRPAGMGRKMIVMAGFFLSGMLGLAFAFTIVLLDDRIFYRRDIDRLEIAPVLTVIPGKKRRRHV